MNPSDASTSSSSSSASLLGQTRTRVARNHAVIGPDSHVVAPLHGWTDTEGVVLIAPVLGPAGCGPRFVQALATMKPGSAWHATPGQQRFFYVLDGEVCVDGTTLGPDGYGWLPPGAAGFLGSDAATTAAAPAPDGATTVRCDANATLMTFTKPYTALPGVGIPPRVLGHIDDTPAEPFMDDPAARLAKLLPQTAGFDIEVNRFTFDPGAALPLVECHVNEHGLYMLEGEGVYRLGTDAEATWTPVQQGDTIWMGAYCPQWFCCFGKGPATYLYYKDVNRSVL